MVKEMLEKIEKQFDLKREEALQLEKIITDLRTEVSLLKKDLTKAVNEKDEIQKKWSKMQELVSQA